MTQSEFEVWIWRSLANNTGRWFQWFSLSWYRALEELPKRELGYWVIEFIQGENRSHVILYRYTQACERGIGGHRRSFQEGPRTKYKRGPKSWVTLCAMTNGMLFTVNKEKNHGLLNNSVTKATYGKARQNVETKNRNFDFHWWRAFENYSVWYGNIEAWKVVCSIR